MATYTITDTQFAALQSDAQAVANAIAALVPDPVPNPLQVALDAANATIAQLTSDKAALTDANTALSTHLATLGADISDVDLAIEKAKADE